MNTYNANANIATTAEKQVIPPAMDVDTFLDQVKKSANDNETKLKMIKEYMFPEIAETRALTTKYNNTTTSAHSTERYSDAGKPASNISQYQFELLKSKMEAIQTELGEMMIHYKDYAQKYLAAMRQSDMEKIVSYIDEIAGANAQLEKATELITEQQKEVKETDESSGILNRATNGVASVVNTVKNSVAGIANFVTTSSNVASNALSTPLLKPSNENITNPSQPKPSNENITNLSQPKPSNENITNPSQPKPTNKNKISTNINSNSTLLNTAISPYGEPIEKYTPPYNYSNPNRIINGNGNGNGNGNSNGNGNGNGNGDNSNGSGNGNGDNSNGNGNGNGNGDNANDDVNSVINGNDFMATPEKKFPITGNINMMAASPEYGGISNEYSGIINANTHPEEQQSQSYNNAISVRPSYQSGGGEKTIKSKKRTSATKRVSKQVTLKNLMHRVTKLLSKRASISSATRITKTRKAKHILQ